MCCTGKDYAVEGAVRVALVDDEDAPRAAVASHLHRYSQEHGERFQVSSFSSGEEFTSPYRADYDMIFLDAGRVAATGPVAQFFSETAPKAFRDYIGG